MPSRRTVDEVEDNVRNLTSVQALQYTSRRDLNPKPFVFRDVYEETVARINEGIASQPVEVEPNYELPAGWLKEFHTDPETGEAIFSITPEEVEELRNWANKNIRATTETVMFQSCGACHNFYLREEMVEKFVQFRTNPPREYRVRQPGIQRDTSVGMLCVSCLLTDSDFKTIKVQPTIRLVDEKFGFGKKQEKDDDA